MITIRFRFLRYSDIELPLHFLYNTHFFGASKKLTYFGEDDSLLSSEIQYLGMLSTIGEQPLISMLAPSKAVQLCGEMSPWRFLENTAPLPSIHNFLIQKLTRFSFLIK